MALRALRLTLSNMRGHELARRLLSTGRVLRRHQLLRGPALSGNGALQG